MDYKQIKEIMLSLGLEEGENSEGTKFTFRKGKNHIKIIDRLKPSLNGGVVGYVYVKELNDFKGSYSKHGHIPLRKLESESDLKDIIKRMIEHFDGIWK